MENLDYCFFCCKYLPKEDNLADVKLDDSLNSFDVNAKPVTSLTQNSKYITKYLLPISHYLKVPRQVIQEDEDIFPLRKACPECAEISKNLSDCCFQLEVIKMKISHYLNLITDQIIGISSEQDEETRKSLQSTFSSFQKTVHKSCLLKVRNDEEASNPQIRLKKYVNPQTPKDLTDDIPIDIKMEITTVNSCPFCDFISTGPYNIIHSHIKTAHPEQLQIEKPGPKCSKSTKCPKCSKTLHSRDGLNRHLRESLSCGRGKKRKPLKLYKNRYECSNCKGRFITRANLIRHLKTICKSGMLVDHGPKDHDIPTNPPKFVSVKQTKFPCGSCPIIFNSLENQQRHIETVHVKQMTPSGSSITVKACEYCGAMMAGVNLLKHTKNVHGIGKNGYDKNLIKKFERCSCGKLVNEKYMATHKIRCEMLGEKGNEKLRKLREAAKMKPRKKYYYEKKPPIKCEICEKMIGYRNMSAHKKNVHKMNLYRW